MGDLPHFLEVCQGTEEDISARRERIYRADIGLMNSVPRRMTVKDRLVKFVYSLYDRYCP